MTESEIEMLELAAKAAGHTLSWSVDKDLCWLNEVWDGCSNTDEPWNPLSSNFDAFCLLTRLKLTVQYDYFEEGVNIPYVLVQYDNCINSIYIEKIIGLTDDINADTRLAITSCAAKVAMKLESLK